MDTSDFLLVALHSGFLDKRHTGVQKRWCQRSPAKGDNELCIIAYRSSFADLEASTRLKASYRVFILSKDCWEEKEEKGVEEVEEVGVEHVLQLILRSKR